jgi:hypothetical protein
MMIKGMLAMAVTLSLILTLFLSSIEARAQFQGSPYGSDIFSYVRHNVTLHNLYEARRKRAAYLRKQRKQRKETTAQARKDRRPNTATKRTGK